MKAFLLVTIILLAGCGRQEADLAACDAFVRGGMNKPSSYHRVAFSRTDGPSVDGQDFAKLAGMMRPRDGDPRQHTWDLEQEVYGGSQLALRQLALTYTVEDGKTDQAICAFRLVQGKLEPRETLLQRADRAARADPIAQLDLLQGRRAQRPSRYTCCL